ncbi:hypothetical protein [Sphaerisporangium sp. TRM90804]|uniref:hypothetical protein n=1 Tax=Sphaerisporangium sp. TRM90804 TaxID=3031113 RepID=UPI00244BA1F4|nr:hypothetical protein [Sphaerisporangium sp. TRM90804]MDH2429770.1 hypothetical protein [Sphaerisporangium sp. TRM90804]
MSLLVRRIGSRFGMRRSGVFTGRPGWNRTRGVTMGRSEPPATSAAVTVSELHRRYGVRWDIFDGVAGGWIAVRRDRLSGAALARGMSNVRCAATLDELASFLATETEIENRPWSW